MISPLSICCDILGMDKLKNSIAPSVGTGIVNYGYNSWMHPELAAYGVNVPVLGTVSAQVGIALASAVSVLPGELLGNYAGPALGTFGQIASTLKPIIVPASVGLVNMGITKLIAPEVANNNSTLQMIGEGAISYVGGKYISDMFLKKIL